MTAFQESLSEFYGFIRVIKKVTFVKACQVLVEEKDRPATPWRSTREMLKEEACHTIVITRGFTWIVHALSFPLPL
jgi:hypothetical protein